MSPWIQDRSLIVGPRIALVLSEKAYHEAMQELGIPLEQRPPWISNDQSDATSHFLTSGGDLACVLAMRVAEGLSGIHIAGLLVHEAVHIFQDWRDSVGESKPSVEFEAYSIQSIAQRLMQSFADQTGVQ